MTAIASMSASVTPACRQRPVDGRDHRLQVRPAGHLGHDAAEARVLVDAGGDRVGEQLVPAHEPDAGLVAGRLDAEDQRVPSSTPRSPCWPAPEIQAHHDRVRAGRLVVAAPDADVGEPMPAVQPLARVLSARTSRKTSVQPRSCRLGEQRRRATPCRCPGPSGRLSPRSSARPPAIRRCQQPRVADQRRAVVGHQVEPAAPAAARARRQHLREPRLLAEELPAPGRCIAAMSAWVIGRSCTSPASRRVLPGWALTTA